MIIICETPYRSASRWVGFGLKIQVVIKKGDAGNRGSSDIPNIRTRYMSSADLP